MKTNSALIFHILLSLVSSSCSYDGKDEMAVIAYLPEWRFESANYDVICEHVSHLILFSVEVGQPGSGAIAGLDRLPRVEILEDAKASARRHDTALLICFGGNGRSAGFSRMVRSSKLRGKFIKSLVNFILGYEFDGVDLNWEYPGYKMGQGYLNDEEVQKDYKGLRAFLRQLRQELPQEKIITLAYYPDGRQETSLADAVEYVDYLHSMAYDQPGPQHSSLSLAQTALDKAEPFFQQKHTLGLPFYGRKAKSGEWFTYEDIVQRQATLQPELDTVDDIGFNGISTIQAKVRLSINDNAAGVMIWEVGQDCRVKPVYRERQSHPVTCPQPNASLLLAITSARGNRPLVSAAARRQRGGYTPVPSSSPITTNNELR